jgi:peptidyl-prolyl cis-trans isomerase SurA
MRIAQFLPVFFLFAFGPWLAIDAIAKTTIEAVEATVNQTPILLSEVTRFRKNLGLRSQIDPLFQGTELSSQGTAAPTASIVQFLVEEQMILDQFPVVDAEVDQEINQIASTNKISRDTLKKTLASQGFEFDDYFELIRASVSKRTLIDREIRTRVVISDDDLKNHYYNHFAKDSKVPRNYHFQLIVINPKNFKTTAFARERAESARSAIASGESFEEIAKRLSDDPSGATGGDFGTLPEDQISPQIRDQIKKMNLGETSTVFGSPQTRFYLVKLLGISSGEDEKFNRAKEDLRNQLASREYVRQIQLWLERQKQKAFIYISDQKKSG